MDLPVSLNVHFMGNADNFIVPDLKRSNWESIEAMIKMSFGLGSFQVKYVDEDNEEVSINSQEEYQEALKSAVKQGHQLHMNLYKRKDPAYRTEKTEGKVLKVGFKPVSHYHAVTSTVDMGTQVNSLDQDTATSKKVKGNQGEESTPPAWFTSYMEQFKNQVVKEAVEKICSEFSGQCCIHKMPNSSSEGPDVCPTLSRVARSTPNCSSCRGQASGVGYQCSVCPSCTLCELCSYGHDPSHSLLRTRTPLSIPEYGVAGEHCRFKKPGDWGFRKAEKQRLKAEKRQLKAEVKEIKKQLRMERRGLQFSGASDDANKPVILRQWGTRKSPERQSCPTIVPTMTALFLDENLPDGTRLQPGTKFIKYWKMRNTGTVCWTTETKLKFMWGNLALASREKQKEVAVPFLQPGQVGVVRVGFEAPVMEGTYTSHWRLAHRGEQFGPRVWCSIVVDPDSDEVSSSPCSKPEGKERHSLEEQQTCCTVSRDCTLTPEETEGMFFIPSVNLLTAQDLLSFELLDINIVQELERVPHNTPVDMTPCMSPLPHDGPVLEKPGLGLIEEEAEAGMKNLKEVVQKHQTTVLAQEDGEEDISGTQFVCETVIRSLTLEEEPEHKPLRRTPTYNSKVYLPVAQSSSTYEKRAEKEQRTRRVEPAAEVAVGSAENSLQMSPETVHEQQVVPECVESDVQSIFVEPSSQSEAEGDGERDEVCSQASSVSSEDYIIILPDCFDTSRPLGESMYSSALSNPGTDSGADNEPRPEQLGRDMEEDPALATPPSNSVNDMLCTSQMLDAVTLTPVVVPACAPELPSSNTVHANGSEMVCAIESAVEVLPVSRLNGTEDPMHGSCLVRSGGPADPSETCDSRQWSSHDLRPHGGLAGGLVKGALSVAASAYKALFTGQPSPILPSVDGVGQDTAMMTVLLEMGFGDRQLNQRLLKKHNCNLQDVVNDLVQMSDNEWYATRY